MCRTWLFTVANPEGLADWSVGTWSTALALAYLVIIVLLTRIARRTRR